MGSWISMTLYLVQILANWSSLIKLTATSMDTSIDFSSQNLVSPIGLPCINTAFMDLFT